MKYFYFVFLLILISCNQQKEIPTNEQVIEESIKIHDPNNSWNTTILNLHIQEPRIRNPYRYSILKLENESGVFELQRNRETSISTHKIDKNENAITFLNGQVSTDSLLIKKYRLDPKRNFGYKRFYQVLTGLPMSLKTEKYSYTDHLQKTVFNTKKAFKISIELEEALFSKNWNLYFSEEDFSMLGVEMIFPDNPKKGERIIFDKTIKIGDLLIPRIRHWHELDNTYSGSDIILKEVK